MKQPKEKPANKSDAGHWRVFDHTADAGLMVFGETAEAALTAAGLGLASMIADRRRVCAVRRVEFTVTSSAYEELLADWLRELLYFHETQRFVFRNCGVTDIQHIGDAFQAVGWGVGEPIDAKRHLLHREVKSVTWHQLSLECGAAGWTGRVILDI